jgi:tetratricopeptide (TPR) repeat protein
MLAKSFSKDGIQDQITYPLSGWTAVTIGDLYKWSQALNTFRFITPSSTYAIIIPFLRDKQAGLGTGAMRNHKIETHVHDGSARNYQALLDVDNTKDRTIIWMTNSRNEQMFAISDAIKHILNDEPYALPKRSVLELMKQPADTMTGVAILRYYEQQKASLSADYAFESESALNSLGYYLLNKKRTDDAILVFEYNSRLFPGSGNAFDSMAEAYYAKGDWKNALIHYSTALRLDSTNKHAREKIIELRSKVNNR